MTVNFAFLQWLSEVQQIVSNDKALAPLLQPFEKPFPQDSPELIQVFVLSSVYPFHYGNGCKQPTCSRFVWGIFQPLTYFLTVAVGGSDLGS